MFLLEDCKLSILHVVKKFTDLICSHSPATVLGSHQFQRYSCS